MNVSSYKTNAKNTRKKIHKVETSPGINSWSYENNSKYPTEAHMKFRMDGRTYFLDINLEEAQDLIAGLSELFREKT